MRLSASTVSLLISHNRSSVTQGRRTCFDLCLLIPVAKGIQAWCHFFVYPDLWVSEIVPLAELVARFLLNIVRVPVRAEAVSLCELHQYVRKYCKQSAQHALSRRTYHAVILGHLVNLQLTLVRLRATCVCQDGNTEQNAGQFHFLVVRGDAKQCLLYRSTGMLNAS